MLIAQSFLSRIVTTKFSMNLSEKKKKSHLSRMQNCSLVIVRNDGTNVTMKVLSQSYRT